MLKCKVCVECSTLKREKWKWNVSLHFHYSKFFVIENILEFVTVWIVKLVMHNCQYKYSVCEFCKQTVIINIYMNIDITIVDSK